MEKRRDNIMDTAERLFNQRGYNTVSLRDIAEELSISKGNLTYYFKKKEDLIEACAVRSHANYRSPDVPETLKELNDFFIMLLTRKADRPYYFQNYAQLAHVCPKVYAIQCSVIEDLSDVINKAIHNLMLSGIFREDCSSSYPAIVQCILTVITYGIVPCREENTDELLACIWHMLMPCLTEKGKGYSRELMKMMER